MITNQNISLSIKLLILFFIIAFLYLLNPNQIINYTLYLAFPLITVMAGVCAVRSYGVKNKHGEAILFITIGFIFMFLGEMGSYIGKYFLDIKTFPAYWDYFYSFSSIFLLWGIVKEMIAYKIKVSIAQISLIVIFLVAVVLFVIYVAGTKDLSPIQYIFTIFYKTFQLSVLVGIYFMIKFTKEFSGGKLSQPWMYIAIGTIFNIIGGVLISINTAFYQAGYNYYTFIVDMVWVIGYLLLAYGFFCLSDTISCFQININTRIKLKKIF